MDGYRYLQPDNADRSGRHCRGIISHDALGDVRRPGARADHLRLRYYPPRSLRRRSSDRSTRPSSVRMPSLQG